VGGFGTHALLSSRRQRVGCGLNMNLADLFREIGEPIDIDFGLN